MLHVIDARDRTPSVHECSISLRAARGVYRWVRFATRMQYPVLEPLGAYTDGYGLQRECSIPFKSRSGQCTDLITLEVRAAWGGIRYARAKERPRQCLARSSAVSRRPETRARPPNISTCVAGSETACLELRQRAAEAAYRGGAQANMPTREIH